METIETTRAAVGSTDLGTRASSSARSHRFSRNMSGQFDRGSSSSKRGRDLALFNVAIDSKLRGCDVVSLRVADIAPHGYALDRATGRQRKTGRPVRFELTEQTGNLSMATLARSDE